MLDYLMKGSHCWISELDQAFWRFAQPSSAIDQSKRLISILSPSGPPAPMPVSISVNGGPPTLLPVPSGWADYSVPLLPGAGEPGKTVTLTITSPTRSPAQYQPNSPDTRNLGVGVERVSLSNR